MPQTQIMFLQSRSLGHHKTFLPLDYFSYSLEHLCEFIAMSMFVLFFLHCLIFETQVTSLALIHAIEIFMFKISGVIGAPSLTIISMW